MNPAYLNIHCKFCKARSPTQSADKRTNLKFPKNKSINNHQRGKQSRRKAAEKVNKIIIKTF